MSERHFQKERPLFGAAGIVIQPADRGMCCVKVMILLARPFGNPGCCHIFKGVEPVENPVGIIPYAVPAIIGGADICRQSLLETM